MKTSVFLCPSFSQLMEKLRQATAATAGLQAQIEEAGRKTSHLEQQVAERGAEYREVTSLRRELENLRTLTHSQEQRVAHCQKEAQQSQAELASLEAILALLHVKEVGRRVCSLSPVIFLLHDQSNVNCCPMLLFRVQWDSSVPVLACCLQWTIQERHICSN